MATFVRWTRNRNKDNNTDRKHSHTTSPASSSSVRPGPPPSPQAACSHDSSSVVVPPEVHSSAPPRTSKEKTLLRRPAPLSNLTVATGKSATAEPEPPAKEGLPRACWSSPSCTSSSFAEKVTEVLSHVDQQQNAPSLWSVVQSVLPSPRVLVPDPQSLGADFAARPFVLCVCTVFPPCFSVFLSGAVSSGDFGVVLLCQDYTLANDAERISLLESFDDDEGKPLVKLVLGDVLDRRHLKRAGVVHAHAVCILSAAGEETPHDAGDCDRQNSLLYAKIHDIMLLESASAPLIAEVHSADSVRFLDPTLWWPSDQSLKLSYVQAPSYASGHFFAASMLHPLVGYSYFMPLLMPLLQNFVDVQDVTTSTGWAGQDEAGREGLQLWLVPSELYGHTFERLFYAMQLEGLLAIGLLRCPTGGKVRALPRTRHTEHSAASPHHRSAPPPPTPPSIHRRAPSLPSQDDRPAPNPARNPEALKTNVGLGVLSTDSRVFNDAFYEESSAPQSFTLGIDDHESHSRAGASADYPYVYTCPYHHTVLNPGDRVYVVLPEVDPVADISVQRIKRSSCDDHRRRSSLIYGRRQRDPYNL